MNLRSLFRSPFERKQESIPTPAVNKAGKIESGQKSQVSILGSYSSVTESVVAKREFIFDLDVDELRKYPTTTLLKNLHYLNPDASMAIWTMLRLANSGYSIKAANLDGSENIEGYEYLTNEVLPVINRDRGGFDAFVDMIHKTTLILGAGSCEVVLGSNLREVLDIVAVDPSTIYFKQKVTPDGQQIYEPFQYQSRGQISLDKPGFYYVPLDVDIGDPSGVSSIVSMLQVIFFQMQMFHDLQRVIHTQGYPRIDIKILEEVIRNTAPRQLLNNAKKLVEFIDTQIGLIKNYYADLKPDDCFIHTDAIDVKVVEANQQLGANARAILDAVDKALANSMHILTIFINKHRGITETYGSVQWKIQVKTIESFQRVSSRIINDALTFVLNINGMQGYAYLVYEPIPTESPFQQEEAEIMKVKRVTFMRDAGFIAHDTAASMLTDMETAEAEPVPMFGPNASGGGSEIGATTGEGAPAGGKGIAGEFLTSDITKHYRRIPASKIEAGKTINSTKRKQKEGAQHLGE